MKRPKRIKSKQWQLLLEIAENNKKIVKNKMKNPLYVMDELDKMLLGKR